MKAHLNRQSMLPGTFRDSPNERPAQFMKSIEQVAQTVFAYKLITEALSSAFSCAPPHIIITWQMY